MGASDIDEGAVRAVQSGRQTVGALLGTAKQRLRIVFGVFVVGLLAGIVLMRTVVWPALKQDLLVRHLGARVVAQTPFDVILLQVKLGLIVGVLCTVPALLYFARDPLKERGIIQRVDIDRWKVLLVAGLATVLFVGGALYAYLLFFPIMFEFLATNAANAGLSPTYSIVHWTQFILILGLSFGLAAQLPLVMTALAYSGVVPYEVWRDRWKHAIVVMFAFGAVFSPPDPFTQIMWALPLVSLYGFSLYLTKILVSAKRGSESVDVSGALRAHWNQVAGVAVLAAGAVVALFRFRARANEALTSLPVVARPGPVPRPGALLGTGDTVALAVVAALAALLGGLIALAYAVYRRIAATQQMGAGRGPAAIDVGELDAEGVRAAPDEAFAAMDEEAAMDLARVAIDAENREKAQAIVERYEAVDTESGDGEAAGDATDSEGAEETEGGFLTRRTAGVVDAFTESETTEEEVGGYYYDLAFVLDSLRSKAFRIVGLFMLVLGSVFAFLYSGGIGLILDDFLARLPAGVARDEIPFSVVTLHPVEALVFEAKISALLGLVAVVPLLVYYAWPAIRRRGLASGERSTIVLWGGSMLVGLIGGTLAGYLFVAPEIISWLVYDAIREDMVIVYRVSDFFWLVVLTTTGIGLLVDIPITMVLFYRGGIVSYSRMRGAWRGVALGAFVLGALMTPDSMYTMFVIALPTIMFYWIGLGILWMITLGGRRARSREPEQTVP
ncbi:MAG: Sec-independent protein translocase TatC [Halobacteriaceae archaeon]